MSEKTCSCCCVKLTNQIWVKDKAIDIATRLCNVDGDDDNCCDDILMCPVYSCVWCVANTLVCPQDCCWFITNSCSLCMMSWGDMCCGNQINNKCKYVCCTFQEHTLIQYEKALNQGYPRYNAYRVTLNLPPMLNDQSKLITQPSPFHQSMI
jgi:hypothetical protein